MRIYPGIGLTIGLLAGAAWAAGDPPQSGTSDPRWRAPGEYRPSVQPVEGEAPAGIAARSCRAFEDENFAGRRLDAGDGVAMEWVGRAWNDRISSIACAPGCRLIAYQTIVFGGARANFTGARPTLGLQWNDRISALRVACDGDQAAAQHH